MLNEWFMVHSSGVFVFFCYATAHECGDRCDITEVWDGHNTS